MQKILHYFPELSDTQIEQFEKLFPLYREWNQKINVISRNDIDNLEVHHILHSLYIARFITFDKGSKVLDIGSGGGFPGIPLAIMFPAVYFHLVDSIGKKVRVMQAVIDGCNLENVRAEQINVQDVKGKYDYVVCRAFKSLAEILKLTKNLSDEGGKLVCLKGGDLKNEIREAKVSCKEIDLDDYFDGEYFREKKLLIIEF